MRCFTGAQGSGPAAPGGSDPGSAGGVLLPLQPYKLLYAQLLAEYGHVPEALAYCQVRSSHKVSQVFVMFAMALACPLW